MKILQNGRAVPYHYFQCPYCGKWDSLEEILIDVVANTPVTDMTLSDTGELYITYGDNVLTGDPSDHYYQCVACGTQVHEEVLIDQLQKRKIDP